MVTKRKLLWKVIYGLSTRAMEEKGDQEKENTSTTWEKEDATSTYWDASICSTTRFVHGRIVLVDSCFSDFISSSLNEFTFWVELSSMSSIVIDTFSTCGELVLKTWASYASCAFSSAISSFSFVASSFSHVVDVFSFSWSPFSSIALVDNP